MKKIDNSTATAQNEFTAGNPSTGLAATILDPEWLNILQAEIIEVVEQGGLTPDQTGVAKNQLHLAIAALISAGIPAGETPGKIAPFGTDVEPSGWLECDGSTVSRTTYADIFSSIGTRWGAGDGSTTFKLPDLRGEFLRGFDNGRGIDVSRAIASLQLDSFQGFSPVGAIAFDVSPEAAAGGETYYNAGGGTVPTNNPDWDARGDSVDSLSRAKTYIVSDGVNGTPRVSTETRGRNAAVMFCIKI